MSLLYFIHNAKVCLAAFLRGYSPTVSIHVDTCLQLSKTQGYLGSLRTLS